MPSIDECEWPVIVHPLQPAVLYVRVPTHSVASDQAADKRAPERIFLSHDRLKFGITTNLPARSAQYSGDGGIMAFWFLLPSLSQARCVEIMLVEEFASAVARVAGAFRRREYLDRERAARLLGVPRHEGYGDESHCSAHAWLAVGRALFERAIKVAQSMFPDAGAITPSAPRVRVSSTGDAVEAFDGRTADDVALVRKAIIVYGSSSAAPTEASTDQAPISNVDINADVDVDLASVVRFTNRRTDSVTGQEAREAISALGASSINNQKLNAAMIAAGGERTTNIMRSGRKFRGWLRVCLV